MTEATRAERPLIIDFLPNERFEGIFAIGNAQLSVTRNGDHYLAAILSDRSGRCPARKWQIEKAEFDSLPTDGFVYAEGRTQPFKGELQLIVERIEAHEATPEQLRELLPVSKRPIDEMFGEVIAHLDTVQHPAMKALVEEYMLDEMLVAQFKEAPAAKMMHHAYLGGLLEHTLNLLNLADRICPLYPKMNRDLVMVGLFLHDLGKTRELTWNGPFSYSDRGELVGHIVDGVIILHDKAHAAMRRTGMRMPGAAITVLQHIILSHHTEPEYGAAKRPSTPEAILVAQLDQLDARAAIALDCARPDQRAASDLGGNFTEKQWSLSTKVYRPDPLL